jgi:Asp-tRNA(Asn)/Glu-tRNA(Gln) amidotransferase A subunit family amidase
LSMPAGFVEREGKKLPWGFHILWEKWSEVEMLKFAKWVEERMEI